MREFLEIYINGEYHKVVGDQASLTLSDYLRYISGLKGTKVVCAEGDCGACTVMVGTPTEGKLSYTSINSCISMMCLLDGHHIVTVEGISTDEEDHEIQKCMVENNGAQCGFCTPGFVMSMVDLYETHEKVDEKKCRNYLTGNLCRCTGYSSILDAALSVDPNKSKKLKDLYPEKDLCSKLASICESNFEIKTEEFEFFSPNKLADALELKQRFPDIKIISSSTDLGVQINKERFEPKRLMTLDKIAEVHEICNNGNYVEIGARVNFTQIEKFYEGLDSEFSSFLHLFASPQIKNFGTLVGNIANASPIADSLPFLAVMEAELVLTSVKGERKVAFNSFYKGYKDLDLANDEIITRVLIPIRKEDEHLRLYKVSRRKDLDISCVNAAFKMTLNNKKISQIKIAYGGVGPTVLRLPKLESELLGKEFKKDIIKNASYQIEKEITPMSDVRGSDEYRYGVAKNLLQRFYLDIARGLNV